MTQPSAYHRPVMRAEVLELFAPTIEAHLATSPRVWVVDTTFGGGGHSFAILEMWPEAHVLGIDRDPDAAGQAREDPRLRFVQGNFGDLEQLLESQASDEPGLARPVAVLFDLGVSSHQLDAPERGFSYHRAGPLDMRMGPDASASAADIVNGWDERAITSVIRRFGEERYATRIAHAIVEARPIVDTAHLARVVADAVPAPARRRRHPARRTFQAIRIAANAELEALKRGLDAAIDRIAPGGRVAVISYHSLEDRAVKRRFASLTTGCICPPDLPVCGCGRSADFRLLTRSAVVPSAEEIETNPRSRSAKLRAIERLA